MAFGKRDTIALYDGAIKPVLHKLGVRPVIVNRTASNQDLNLQIIAHLDACDFCIADLTYARPSVYFEAGFAERCVEVIYTVRSDHLHHNQSDDLRVHFDLRMKPLIEWKDAKDKGFVKRLDARIRSTALREFRLQQAYDEKRAKEEATFCALSPIARLRRLLATADRALKRAHLRLVDQESPAYLVPRPQPSVALVYSAPGAGSRSLIRVTLQVSAALTKDQVQLLQSVASPYHILSSSQWPRKMRHLSLCNIAGILAPISAHRVEQLFPSLGPLGRQGLYGNRSPIRAFAADPTAPLVWTRQTLLCLGAVRSTRGFEEAIQEALKATNIGRRVHKRISRRSR